MSYTGPTDFEVLSCDEVHDGDTFWLTVKLGFRATLQINGRLDGWDTPEIGATPGRVASAFEKERARVAREWTKSWWVFALNNGGAHVKSTPGPVTYNRWLVVPYSWPDHQPLGESLMRQGLAVPWHRTGDLKWWQVYDRPDWTPGSTTVPPRGGAGS